MPSSRQSIWGVSEANAEAESSGAKQEVGRNTKRTKKATKVTEKKLMGLRGAACTTDCLAIEKDDRVVSKDYRHVDAEARRTTADRHP